MTSKTLDSLGRFTRASWFKLLSPPTMFAVFLALFSFHALAFIPFEYFYNLLKKLFYSPNRMWILLKRRNVLLLLLTDFSLEPLSCFCCQFSSVQSLSRVWLFATPWIAADQASLSITNSWSSLKLMSIESVMPSNHLLLSSPFPPAPNPSQHQSLFQSVNSLHEVAKVLEFQL